MISILTLNANDESTSNSYFFSVSNRRFKAMTSTYVRFPLEDRITIVVRKKEWTLMVFFVSCDLYACVRFVCDPWWHPVPSHFGVDCHFSIAHRTVHGVTINAKICQSHRNSNSIAHNTTYRPGQIRKTTATHTHTLIRHGYKFTHYSRLLKICSVDNGRNWFTIQIVI